MLRVGQQPREFCRSSNSQCASQSGRRCCGWDSSRESFVVLLIASVPAQVVGEVAGGTAGGVGSGAVFGMDSAAGSSDSANKAAPTKQSILSYGGLTVCLISCQAVAVLHPPPSAFSRRLNSDGEGASAAWQHSRQRLRPPLSDLFRPLRDVLEPTAAGHPAAELRAGWIGMLLLEPLRKWCSHPAQRTHRPAALVVLRERPATEAPVLPCCVCVLCALVCVVCMRVVCVCRVCVVRCCVCVLCVLRVCVVLCVSHRLLGPGARTTRGD